MHCLIEKNRLVPLLSRYNAVSLMKNQNSSGAISTRPQTITLTTRCTEQTKNVRLSWRSEVHRQRILAVRVQVS